jgi:hypothetical protein
MEMKEYFFIGLAIAVGVFLGALGFSFVHPSAMTGGDFAGGIQPSQLLTANVTTNSVTPSLSNLYVNGSISAGGVAANNQLAEVYTGVTVWPLSATTIATSSFASAATTTSVAFTSPGFAIGDPCVEQYSGTTSTLIMSGQVTAVSGSAVTSTVTILNATGASVSVTVTSTVTGVSSTLKTTCFATGV